MHGNSLFSIDSAVLEAHPGVGVATFVLDPLQVSSTSVLDAEKAAITERVRREYAAIDLATLTGVATWRHYFEKMHINPAQVPPAHEGLVTRLLEGKPFPNIFDVVDACNITAATHLLPVGAFNLDAIVAPISLRQARKGETMVPMFSNKPRGVQQGEVVYADSEKIFSRYSKDADSTKVTAATTRVFVVIDQAPGQERPMLEEAALSLQDLFERLLGVPAKATFHPA